MRSLMSWIRSLRKPVDAERSARLDGETAQMVQDSRRAIDRAHQVIESSRRADEAVRQYRAGL